MGVQSRQSGPVDHRAHTVVAGPCGPPAHAARPTAGTGRRTPRTAVLAAVGPLVLGAVFAVRVAAPSDDAASTATSARNITAAPRIPLSAAEVADLTRRPAELGALADPERRAGCLAAIGHPGRGDVLGAREMRVAGRTAIVLILPGARPAELLAVAVEPDCSGQRGLILADTTVPVTNPAPP